MSPRELSTGRIVPLDEIRESLLGQSVTIDVSVAPGDVYAYGLDAWIYSIEARVGLYAVAAAVTLVGGISGGSHDDAWIEIRKVADHALRVVAPDRCVRDPRERCPTRDDCSRLGCQL